LEYLRLIHRSMILDNIWTRFLGGGATYTWERLIGEYIRYALFSDRQHLSCDVCLDSGGKKGKYQNCSVLYCVLLYRVWCKYAVYSFQLNVTCSLCVGELADTMGRLVSNRLQCVAMQDGSTSQLSAAAAIRLHRIHSAVTYTDATTISRNR